MHIKKRGNRAMLYRSHWVPKGANGNSHGYSQQTFIGSLPTNAEALPTKLATKLSADELAFLETKLFQPARLAEQQKMRAEELREADPIWRLADAERLANEAAQRSERFAVPNSRLTSVQSALARVRTITQTHTQAPTAAQQTSDPLKDALTAIKAARDAVLAGRYGTAPAEGVRSTAVYKLWSDIFEAVGSSDGNSLMRALQTKGFAKTRGK
ncbi:hypothetical protein LP414_09455 [Polaromonas sp. P1(28)-13]|nr:hypothetical protein LP414_09455 [Polaromonas sp. P1(28)-13]